MLFREFQVLQLHYSEVSFLYAKVFKRLFDIIFSILLMPFFLILCVAVGIAIKLDDGGPIFYCGERLGRHGKKFKMYKFRSMKVNAPDWRLEDGSTYNAEDDPRQTRVGKIIRKTSIDEVPQLINILKGEMSFVGPRPDPVDWLERYTDEEKVLLDVLPGITGYNQAYYRNSTNGYEKIKNDVYYAQNVTFINDLKIIFATIFTIVFRKNIYKNQDNLNKNRKQIINI